MGKVSILPALRRRAQRFRAGSHRTVKSMELVDVYSALFLASEEDVLKQVLENDAHIW